MLSAVIIGLSPFNFRKCTDGRSLKGNRYVRAVDRMRFVLPEGEGAESLPHGLYGGC